MVLEAGIGARWTYEKVIEWNMTDTPSSSQTYGSRIMFLMVREISSGVQLFWRLCVVWYNIIHMEKYHRAHS
jgi:hypothetical protein